MTKNELFLQPNKDFIEDARCLIIKGIESGRITLDDAKLIREFISEVKSEGELSGCREYKLTNTAILNREFMPEYRKATLADVRFAKSALMEATKDDGSPRFKPNTLHDRVNLLKRFILWMVESGYSDIDAVKLRKFHSPRPDKQTKTAAQMLSEDEIFSMVKACRNARDRALISTLYEGALRIGEIASMTWKDLRFNDTNVTIYTDFKTGKPRNIPVIASREYLSQWKNDYPGDPTGDNFVFVTFRGGPMKYPSLLKHIRGIAARAGIQKHVTLHLFRHSRITALARSGMSESTIKLLAWGSLQTTMMGTYAHLTLDDVTASLEEMSGIQRREKTRESKKMKPVQCPHCGNINSPGMQFCGTCGTPLDESALSQTEVVLDMLKTEMSSNPAFLMEVFQQIQNKKTEVGN